METQVITITVTQINDAGSFAGNVSATTNEDTATAGTVTFTDAVDGFTTPNFSLNTAASNGVAAIDAAGNWTYTPTANYNGADSFTVQVTDDDGNVETQVVLITVTQINNAGTFAGDTTATTDEDTATAGTVTFTDAVDGFTMPNFSLNTAASNGVAAIDAAGNWTYTPTANFNGSDSFIVQVTDDDGNVETQVITITVTQINDTGTFGGNVSATTNEDTATAGTVTFTDAVDGFTMPNFSLNTAASNGVAAIDAAGNWTYTPTANFNGADSFTVQVTDDDGNVETQVITITVTGVNNAGTFGGDTTATTDEDTATAGTVTFTDAVDGFTTPNFSLNTAASNGVAAIDAAGNWTYTPTANFNGSDSFIVQVTDDDGNVETQVITITVTGVNNAGTFAGDTTATTDEDTATAGTVTFSDTVDGFTTPNFSINTAATNGVAAINAAGNWTYTPTANFNGADSFTVQVTDDDGNIEIQVISLTVTPIDDAGTFGGNVSATTNEDTATAGTVTFSDTVDGFTTPNFSINTAATNGTAAIDAAGNWTYTPTANYNGADSFTVQVTDDDGNVETQVISLTVTPIDDAGSFGGNVSATTNEDTATAGTVTFTDTADGFTTPNFSINTAASNGVAAIDAAGNWTYTPTANFNGADSFTVQVTDDDGNIETQVISLTVTPINDAGSFGGNVSATTNEDTATAGTVTFSDTADGFTTPNFSINTAATNGVAAINAAGNWTYTPSSNYNGADSFTVQVTDDDGNIETQVVLITVTQINDAGSFAGNVSATTNEDTATAGTVTFTDTADGFTTPNYSINTAASNGVAAIDAAGNWTYTPTANYNGADSFTVQVTDDDGNVETQVISITVTQINDAGSFAGNVSATTNEDTATAGTVTFSDTADGFTTPNFSINTAATNGTAAIDAAGNWTYTPTANYNGADSFTVQVTDDDGNVETQVISLTVTPINDAGTFGGNVSATTNEDTATAGTVTFTDAVDGFTTPNFSLNTAATMVSPPLMQLVIGRIPQAANYNGADSFTVQVTDDDGNVETQVVSITVTAANDAPLLGAIGNQSVDELVNLSFTATATDSDLPADTLTFSLDAASLALGMNIDANTGIFSWTPTEGQGSSAPSVTITVTDSGTGNLVDSEMFTITVNDVNVAPVLGTIGNQSVNELVNLSFTAIATDTDLPADTLTFSLDAASLAAGMTIDANTGVFSWTPTGAQGGTAPSVTVTVTDSGTGNLVDSETFIITVYDAPVANNDSAIVNEGESVNINLAANDTDMEGAVDLASIVITSAPSNGSVVVNADGTVNYTHNGSETIADSFTYTIMDVSGVVSNVATVSLTINPVNDAPTALNDTPAAVNEGGTAIFDLVVNDFDLDNALDLNSIAILGAPVNGSLVVNGNGTVTYTHDGSETISDSFSYTIADISGAISNIATVTITINPVNDAPSAVDDVRAVNEGNAININLTANDVDIDNALDLNSIVIVGGPVNGTVIVNGNGTVDYTHDGSETSNDSFTYTIADISGVISNVATVNIIVNSVNDSPTTIGITNVTLLEDPASSTTINLNNVFEDADNLDSDLTYSITGNTSIGLFNTTAVNAATGELVLDYAANMSGSSQISVRATDPSGASVDTLFTVTVTPVNDAPVMMANTGLAASGINSNLITNAQLNVNDIDNTNAEILYIITELPGNGELTINGVVATVGSSFSEDDLINNNVSYQPGGTGTNDQFGFTVTDGAGGSVTGNSFNIVVQLAAVPVEPEESVEPEVTPDPEESDTAEMLVTQVVSLTPIVEQTLKPIGGNSMPQQQQPVLTLEPVLEQRAAELTEDIDDTVESYVVKEKPEVSKVDFSTARTYADIQVKSIQALWTAIDEMKQDMNENVTDNVTGIEFRSATVSSSGVALTAGVVAWVLRSGALMTSLLSTIPLWKGYDPLPLLAYKDDNDKEKEKITEDKIPTSLEELKKVKALKEKMEQQMKVDRLFGHTGIGE